MEENHDDDQSEKALLIAENISPRKFHDRQLKQIGFGLIQKVIAFYAALSKFSIQNVYMVMLLFADFQQCDWRLEVSNLTTINTCFLAGTIVGSIIFGITSDKLSKKYSLLFFNFIMSVSSFCIIFKNYSSLFLLKIGLFLLGFGLGGSALNDSYLADFFTFENKGLAVTFTRFSAYFSNLLIPLSAYFTLYSVELIYFLLPVSMMNFLTLSILLSLPESPIKYLQSNQMNSYFQIMRKLAKYNNVQFCIANEEEDLSKNIESTIIEENIDIKIKRNICLISILAILHGIICQSFLLETNKIEHGFTDNMNITRNTTAAVDDIHKCTKLTEEDLSLQVASAIGGIVGGLISPFVISNFKCKKMMFVSYSIFAGIHLFLLMNLNIWVFAFLIFCSHILFTIANTAVTVYVVEFAPLTITTVMVAISITCNRIGSIIGSYMIEYLFIISRNVMLIGTNIVPVICSFLAILLIETNA